MAAFSLFMSAKKIDLPEQLGTLIRYLCTTCAEIRNTFQLPAQVAEAVRRGDPVKVTAKQLDIIQSVCSNELNYAFSTRIQSLLQNEKTAAAFVAWVNTAAAMLDSFRTMQMLVGTAAFINKEDPFLSPLYHTAMSMNEVAGFLQQLHQKCPQFDGLFFRGTRFLDDEKVAQMPSMSRVPSSVDVLSLSPEDERMYQQFKESK